MIKRFRKITPYNRRSRRSRKLQYISTKNQIRENASVLGGLFTTVDYLRNGTPWADLYFLSRKWRAPYSVTMETLAHVYVNELFDKACETAESMMPDRYSSSFRDMTEEEQKARELAIFGKSWFEWLEHEQRRLAMTGEILVRESVEFDYSYWSGIGLHVIVDVPILTVPSINDFITMFLDNGEREMIGAESRSFGPEVLDHNSAMFPNLLVEPKDWDKVEMGVESEPDSE